MNPRRLRRAAAAILATTSSLLPVALWAEPAAAAPGPITFDAQPCAITVSGTGYDELLLYRTDAHGNRYYLYADDIAYTVEYGAWLVATGDTATFDVEGRVGGQTVETAGPVTLGPCATGAAVEVGAEDVGTPPSPDDGTYQVWLQKCSIGTAGTRIDVTAATTRLVPVPVGVPFCVGAQTDGLDPVALVPSPKQVTVGVGGTAAVAAHAEWIGHRVLLRIPAGIPAAVVDDGDLTWSASGGGGPDVGGECWITGQGGPGNPGPLQLGCGDAPRVRPGGTFELAMTGVPGWSLAQPTFSSGNCDLVDHYGVTVCALDVHFVGPGGGGGAGGGGGGGGQNPPPAGPATACDAAAVNPFVDVSPSSVHGANVVCAADRQLVRGGPGGRPADQFGPTLTTSRGQLATLVVNLLTRAGVVLVQGAPDAFADDDTSVHEDSINRLAALGVVGGNGESGTSFAPGRAATRSEIASFLRRAHDVAATTPLPAGPDAFGDDEGDPAEADIDALAAAGLLVGKAPGVFEPAATVTREQLATLLVRLADRIAAG